EKGKKQEKLVIPADIQLFGDIVGSSAKSVSFESDADIDYGYFFTRAFRLETLILPAKLSHLGLHSNCPHLKELEVPEGVTVIPVCCFQNDTALESITFKGNLTEIGNLAFVKCSALNNIRLPDSVERIGIGAFGDCSSLREITLPKNLKEIGENAFANIGLETVIVPAELELEKWDATAFEQSNKTYTVKVKEGSWADTHFDEVFAGKAIKEYDS
ncbi:MAG: leucine-rich repeat domain-containing protein, partial [Lachnospiraceae bacterium]|nr:leucine-rich repeat domain-containing protein [Lachnospiraceae bacterium]